MDKHSLEDRKMKLIKDREQTPIKPDLTFRVDKAKIAKATRFYESLKRKADVCIGREQCLRKDGTPRPITRILFDHKSPDTPIAWIVPNLATADECKRYFALAETAGLNDESSYRLITARRTNNFVNADLSKEVAGKLPRELLEEMEKADGLESHGIHPNWRFLSYGPGKSFPAHRDQGDSLHVKHEDGTKDLLYASHTLLLSLTPGPLEGGETRFYPRGSYDYAVDIALPRGWALVFRIKNLLHCGKPVRKGQKHVAQTGILRLLPPGRRFKPSVFKYAPGLMHAFEKKKRDEVKANM
eukprot:CAMPEP_0167797200 /NCGR_PEP_ID=MMETSP0111_2-20121227/15503_1 /TAXON_ID=91324 /ORGANISM="Lotharella globosa, Strain CCCM811" /LENGTH=298 /DNA_ID=CAMNT_0007691241 /DNA_START=42 /DNA_END=935 /DNA_ORIENTATION=-